MESAIKTHLRVTLRDKNNGTYRGRLLLKNWTVYNDHVDSIQHGGHIGSTANPTELVDPLGASYYVIAVVLVYGMSIVALIASHIKRKHGKLIEDRQINKYLREFQTVKEKQSRESYKNLKKRIKEQINWDKPNSKTQTVLHHNLSQALLPMIAVGMSVPQLQDSSLANLGSGSIYSSLTSISPSRSRASSAESRGSIASSHGVVDISDSSPSRERHDRKRGLVNLISNSNREFPLEKILEESMNSQRSFHVQFSDRETQRRGLDKQGKTVKFVPPQDYDLQEVVTSELGSSEEQLDTPVLHHSLGDSGMGSTSPDTEFPPASMVKYLPSVHKKISGGTGAFSISQNFNSYRSPNHLSVPLPVSPCKSPDTEEEIWIHSDLNSPNDVDDGNCNIGFRYSPLPKKGILSLPNGGGSASPVRSPVPHRSGIPTWHYTEECSTDSSDSEAELLQITCV